MSFSKARIQRFNDIKPCAPSPAAYSVINKDKIKGSVTSQSEREPRSPTTISETGSTQSVPCRFRTPILPKKKKTTTSAIKAKQLFPENGDAEVLKEKIVECENKDAFIKSLTEEIEDLKDKISNLNQQKKQLDLQKIKTEEIVVNLKNDHNNEMSLLTKKFKEDLNRITEEKAKVTDEIALVKQQYEELKEANRKEMLELKNNCDKFSVLYNKSLEEYNKLIEEKDDLLKNKESELQCLENNCIEMQRKHSLEIEKLQKEHQLEIQDIEFELLKTMTELQKEKEQASIKVKEIDTIMKNAMEDLKREFDKDREQLLLQYEEKVREVTDHVKATQECWMKEKLEELENEWKKELDTQQRQSDAILQECQTISEYNIIQCELEKKDIETKLLEKNKELEDQLLQYNKIVSNYENFKREYGDLQGNFSKTMNGLKKANEMLNNTLLDKNNELKKYSEENRTYLITIKNFQNTIEVLKKRLVNSDKDVVQLKTEIADNEEKLLEYENKCIQLTSDLKRALEYNDELELQHESAIKLNTNEIEKIKAELLEKVENYRKEAETLSKKLTESEEVKAEIMQQLHEAVAIIEKLKMEYECFDTINCQYEFEVEQSQNELEDYRIREMDWNNVREKLEHTVKELEGLLEIKQDEVYDYKKQLSQLQEKCESYYQNSEYYRNKVAEYEEELEQTGNIHKKYIEQSGKYDELLQKFEELEKENLEKQMKILKLSNDCEEKEIYVEKFNRQKEAYDALLTKYEQLEKESSGNKKKVKENTSLKNFLEKTEQDREALLGRVHYLEGELKEVSDKYADLAGHHNNKQKIKHLVDLKMKNEELIQANMDMELKMRSQLKTIEKLKKENSDLKKYTKKNKIHPGDKENVASPNRSSNASRVESPFRERN